MQDLTKQVQAALETYLHWGQVAAQAMGQEQIEGFFLAMASRDEAFALLLALDGRAEPRRPEGPVFHDLWLQIDQVNRTLQGLMADVQGSLRQQLGGAPKLRLVKSA